MHTWCLEASCKLPFGSSNRGLGSDNPCKKVEREKQKAEAESWGYAHSDEAAAGREGRKGKSGVRAGFSQKEPTDYRGGSSLPSPILPIFLLYLVCGDGRRWDLVPALEHLTIKQEQGFLRIRMLHFSQELAEGLSRHEVTCADLINQRALMASLLWANIMKPSEKMANRTSAVKEIATFGSQQDQLK